MDKYLKNNREEKFKVYEIKSVNEFVELTTWFDEKVIFRGQKKCWTLLPSIAHNKEHSLLLPNESKILNDFRRESIPYIDYVPQNNWQWLALAQHHRLPTRLLDWSKNPLAALWFAVRESPEDNNPAVVWVYYCDSNEIIVADSSKSGEVFEIEQTFIYLPEHITPSIQAQAGVFTVHHRKDEASDFEPLEKNSHALIKKIEILPKSFSTIRYQLHRLNINAASLFPSLQGIAEKIRYENIKCEDEI